MFLRVTAPLCLILSLAALPSGATEDDHPACRMAPDVQAAVDENSPNEFTCYGDPACWKPIAETLQDLLAKHPDVVPLHRTYQSLILNSQGDDRDQRLDELRERYEALLQEHPEHPGFHYLRGRLAPTEDEDRHFRKAVELGPDYPWGHLGRTSILRRTASEAEDREASQEEALSHLLRFLELCPSRVDLALRFTRSLGDAELWRPRLASLRERVNALPELARLTTYPLLWSLAFRVTPPPEHDAVRQWVRDDLTDLETYALDYGSYGHHALENGYESVGDTDALTALGQGMLRDHPCTSMAADFYREQRNEVWTRRQEAAAEVSQEDVREDYEEALRLTEKCPNDFVYAHFRFIAARELDDLSNERFLAEADRYLEVWDAHRWRYKMQVTPWLEVVDELLERDLALERAPGLVERHLEQRDEWNADSPIDRWPAYMRARLQQGQVLSRLTDLAKLATVHTRLGHVEETREALARYEERLHELNTLEGDHEDELQEVFSNLRESQLWRLRGKLAEARDAPLDALAYYHRTLVLDPEDEEAAERAEALWTELGGTPEGWAALRTPSEPKITEAAENTGWLVKNEPLGDSFELVDMQGKTWTPDDLRGKTILLNLWATWCGPCRQEMPEIVRLHERVKDRDDVAVLTLNADANPGLIQSFLAEYGMEMPVLLAQQYLHNKLEGALSIPQNWIVDPEGVLRYQQTGYSPDQADGFVDEMLAKMESVDRNELGDS